VLRDSVNLTQNLSRLNSLFPLFFADFPSTPPLPLTRKHGFYFPSTTTQVSVVKLAVTSERKGTARSRPGSPIRKTHSTCNCPRKHRKQLPNRQLPKNPPSHAENPTAPFISDMERSWFVLSIFGSPPHTHTHSHKQKESHQLENRPSPFPPLSPLRANSFACILSEDGSKYVPNYRWAHEQED